METIIDLMEMPPPYASWAFQNSGCEAYWESEEAFYADYEHAGKTMALQVAPYQEYDLYKRFELLASEKLRNSEKSALDMLARKLFNRYWKTYQAMSFVKEDVKSILPYLKGKYRLGIVSNFKVRGGIEDLLSYHQLSEYFDFVVTSIHEGWRKPHPQMFEAAISQSQCKMSEIVYVGDDYECDLLGARKAGIYAILLDRSGQNQHIKERIVSLDELKDVL
jgi:putative hydrolase of the HAD superfamily